MNEDITLNREVEAIQIPSGDSITLPMGTQVVVTQTLGGTYTVATSSGLVRISSQDADSLGIDLEEKQEKQEEAERLKSAPIEQQVWHQLKQVFDPEIPVDIVNLGLVYDCSVSKANGTTAVAIKMTLTAPGCGMGPVLVEEVKSRVSRVPNVSSVEVELVFDPPWSRDMMTEEAQLELGLF